MLKPTLVAAALALTLAGCAMYGSSTPALKDGDIALPQNYTAWPVFLTGIDKAAAKQIRDIYVNTRGAAAQPGQPFPEGTEFAMEIHSVKLDAEGNPVKGADGKLVKDKLSKVFLMAKGAGWGASAPEGLKNGDWVYAAYDASGKNQGADMNACRACHLPLTDKDFVHRYDEYFQKRASVGAQHFATLPVGERLALAVK